MTTTDLSKFGYRELDIASDLLKAIKTGTPDDFYHEGITVMMNTQSGCVFLTNDDCDVAVLEDGELVSFYSSPYDGLEGTFKELLSEYESNSADWHEDDIEWFVDIAKNVYNHII